MPNQTSTTQVKESTDIFDIIDQTTTKDTTIIYKRVMALICMHAWKEVTLIHNQTQNQVQVIHNSTHPWLL